MREAIKLLYMYLLEYGWEVHDQYREGEEVVITLAPNGPYDTTFKVRLSPSV